jgi:hypothetical protein
MVSVEKLKQFGFVDVSSDQNGRAYRKRLHNKLLEMCYYLNEKHIRLQTIGGGFTFPIRTIENEYHLRNVWVILTGNDIV